MGETGSSFAGFDPTRVPSPCHVIDLAALEHNLTVLRRIADEADVKVLLALKAFSCFAVADLIGRYLHGTAASGLWEARLGRTCFAGEVHTYVPGLKQDQLAEILDLPDVLTDFGLIRSTVRLRTRHTTLARHGRGSARRSKTSPRKSHSPVSTGFTFTPFAIRDTSLSIVCSQPRRPDLRRS